MMRALRLYQRSGLQRHGAVARSPDAVCEAQDAWRRCCRRFPRGDGVPELVPAKGKRRGRAGLLTGCVQRFFYPDVNRDTARLLSAAGYDVVTPRGQECCGALHLHAGRLDEFRRMAARGSWLPGTPTST